MPYAKIKDGQIEKTGSRPNWRTDEGPLTEQEWIEQGYYPVEHDVPEYVPTLQYTFLKPQSEWAIEENRVVAAYEVRDIDIEQMRNTKMQEATDKRWQVMTGGLTLPNGMSVATSIDDQDRITSVVAVAEYTGLEDDDEVDFKAASGWVRITIAEVKQLAGAVGQLVQGCYSVERAHHEAINALETRGAIAEYDVTTGWPE